MPPGLAQLQWSQRKERLLHAARDLVPAMRARTEILDRDACFPSLDFDQLRDIGALSAVIPKRLGGLGLGIDRGGALALFDLLRFLGRGNLAVGRIFEGHVNAFKLISLFGNEVQIERAAEDLTAGHLFAIWNAEAENGVRFRDDLHNVVTGAKAFCSAAGHVTRALITASASAGMRMLLIPLELGERVIPSSIRLHGMRATQTAGIDFDGVNVSADELIGGLDDYLGEPAFSAGA